MNAELIKEIVHLPIPERIEIIKQIWQSVREDLQNSSSEERRAAYFKLRGIAANSEKVPPSDDIIKEDYTYYLMEKHK